MECLGEGVESESEDGRRKRIEGEGGRGGERRGERKEGIEERDRQRKDRGGKTNESVPLGAGMSYSPSGKSKVWLSPSCSRIAARRGVSMWCVFGLWENSFSVE